MWNKATMKQIKISKIPPLPEKNTGLSTTHSTCVNSPVLGKKNKRYLTLGHFVKYLISLLFLSYCQRSSYWMPSYDGFDLFCAGVFSSLSFPTHFNYYIVIFMSFCSMQLCLSSLLRKPNLFYLQLWLRSSISDSNINSQLCRQGLTEPTVGSHRKMTFLSPLIFLYFPSVSNCLLVFCGETCPFCVWPLLEQADHNRLLLARSLCVCS